MNKTFISTVAWIAILVLLRRWGQVSYETEIICLCVIYAGLTAGEGKR